MKAADRYLEILDKWDALAAKQEWCSDWAENEGEAISEYLRRCVDGKYRPTFQGLILYLCEICPKEQEVNAND